MIIILFRKFKTPIPSFDSCTVPQFFTLFNSSVKNMNIIAESLALPDQRF